MAKLECQLKGPFTEIIGALDREILQGSMSASLEAQSDHVLVTPSKSIKKSKTSRNL